MLFFTLNTFVRLHIRAKLQAEERRGACWSSGSASSAQRQQQGCGPIQSRWVLLSLFPNQSVLSQALVIVCLGAPSLMCCTTPGLHRVQSWRKQRASSRARPQKECEEESDGPQQGRPPTHTNTRIHKNRSLIPSYRQLWPHWITSWFVSIATSAAFRTVSRGRPRLLCLDASCR